MGAFIGFIIVIGLLVAFALYVLGKGAKDRFKRSFPTAVQRDKLKTLHKGLVVEEFYGESEVEGKALYINNEFLSNLISEVIELDAFKEYMARNSLKIVSNDHPKITHAWLLCSQGRCIGFNME